MSPQLIVEQAAKIADLEKQIRELESLVRSLAGLDSQEPAYLQKPVQPQPAPQPQKPTPQQPISLFDNSSLDSTKPVILQISKNHMAFEKGAKYRTKRSPDGAFFIPLDIVDGRYGGRNHKDEYCYQGGKTRWWYKVIGS
jgi:hypothetical protein